MAACLDLDGDLSPKTHHYERNSDNFKQIEYGQIIQKLECESNFK